jgi:2,3-bisphosphoglycerate-independent phosphoglycerate mutase
MPVLFIFIDGIGIGDKNPVYNPFAKLPSKYFITFNDNHVQKAPSEGIIIPTRADLEVEGLPQSATGQATLLTGVNTAKLLGYHLEGLPNAALKKIIIRENIFKKLTLLGYRVTFANAYRPSFLTHRKRRISVTTTAALSADLRLRTLDDIAHGEAVYQDYTNCFLIHRGFQVKEASASNAAEILIRLLQDYDFILYEYFLTDIVGHKKKMNEALEQVKKIDDLIEALIEKLDLDKCLLVVTSDHGNLEDLRSKFHTPNKVPTIVWGKDALSFSQEISSLEDITPAIISYLKRVTN